MGCPVSGSSPHGAGPALGAAGGIRATCCPRFAPNWPGRCPCRERSTSRRPQRGGGAAGVVSVPPRSGWQAADGWSPLIVGTITRELHQSIQASRSAGAGTLMGAAAGVVADGLLRWREPAARTLSRMLPAEVLCFVDTDARAFALTFDDGPHRETTPQLLDVLARHEARATFFLIGERVLGNEPIVARIAAEGHEVANHLMRDERSVLLSDLQFRRELAQVNSLLAPYGDVRWCRPGSGWFTPRMLRSAGKQNLRIVLGTVVAMHNGGPGDGRIVRDLLGGIRPGSIVVLHEGTDKRRGVVATTDQVLAGLGHCGLAAVTVSDLVALRR